MRMSTFSDEQIIGILKSAEAGVAVTDVCRQHGISGHTFYRCHSPAADLSAALSRWSCVWTSYARAVRPWSGRRALGTPRLAQQCRTNDRDN